MAIEIGKLYTSDLTENEYKILGIGINRVSDSNGIFAVNYTTLKQAKDNLKNLILTRKGERIMNPLFGCDVSDILFEPMVDSSISQRIEDSILEAVQTYLPYLEIQQILFDYDDEDIDANKIVLDIKFALTINPSLSDNLMLDIKK
jgi:phage baseplate assembly protein W